MSRVTMTREIAMAIGADAANRLKTQKGLKAWDEECLQLAIDQLDRALKLGDYYPRLQFVKLS